MTFFFDRCVGTQIPRALQAFKRFPVEIRYHQEVFGRGHQALADDEWMAPAAQNGWVVVTQDYRFHKVGVTLEAVRQHRAGVFYLWGANAPVWETARVLLWALPRMIERVQDSSPPYVYRVQKSTSIRTVAL